MFQRNFSLQFSTAKHNYDRIRHEKTPQITMLNDHRITNIFEYDPTMKKFHIPFFIIGNESLSQETYESKFLAL